MDTRERFRSIHLVNENTNSATLPVAASDKASIKPLPSKLAHSFMQTTEHVTAMCKALREAGCFTIKREGGTVRAWHTVRKLEVFAAIQKGAGQPWIIRHHKQLFA